MTILHEIKFKGYRVAIVEDETGQTFIQDENGLSKVKIIDPVKALKHMRERYNCDIYQEKHTGNTYRLLPIKQEAYKPVSISEKVKVYVINS